MRHRLVAIVGAVCAAVTAAGCGGGPDGIVVRSPGDTTRAVVYVHGAGETAESSFDDPENRSLFDALLAAGFAVAATDAGGNAWGNPKSVSAYRSLVAELQEDGYSSFYVLAQSMGGLAAVELIGSVPVKAWAGIFPVCDLSSLYALGGIYVEQIDAAYPVDRERAVRARSPVRFPNVGGLPMRFWASPDDTVVAKHRNTDVCAEIARRRGASVTVTVTRGDHGDRSNFDPAGLVAFFEAA